jgi:hypothetical protein
MKTVSTLAATTCSASAVEASLRANFVRRGSTASIIALRSPGSSRAATQSPTAGAPSRARRRAELAGISPSSARST